MAHNDKKNMMASLEGVISALNHSILSLQELEESIRMSHLRQMDSPALQETNHVAAEQKAETPPNTLADGLHLDRDMDAVLEKILDALRSINTKTEDDANPTPPEGAQNPNKNNIIQLDNQAGQDNRRKDDPPSGKGPVLKLTNPVG